jgi:hypothetical protein
MKLTETQSRELLQKHGVYVTEACDKCGKILGHVRFSRFGEQGEWCSRLCRDGTEKIAVPKSGTPRKYKTVVERHKANARYQRNYRQRQTVGDVRKTPSHRTNFNGVTDAILASGYGSPSA